MWRTQRFDNSQLSFVYLGPHPRAEYFPPILIAKNNMEDVPIPIAPTAVLYPHLVSPSFPFAISIFIDANRAQNILLISLASSRILPFSPLFATVFLYIARTSCLVCCCLWLFPVRFEFPFFLCLFAYH